MVHIAMPAVDKMPEQPSPEKNKSSGAADNGFRAVYNEQKKIHDSRETPEAEKGSENPSQAGEEIRGEKDQKSPDEGGGTSRNAEDSAVGLSEPEAGKKKIKSGKTMGFSLLAEKNSPQKSKTLSRLSGRGEKEITDTGLLAKDSPSSGEELLVGSKTDVEISPAVMTAGSMDEAKGAVMPEQSAPATQTELPLQAVSSSVTADESSRDGRKGRDRRSSDDTVSELKITVDDRRSVRESSPLLKEVPGEGDSSRLTLEFVPSDDVSSAMPLGEQGDRVNNFSLLSSEEQKGAALLDRQLQDKGTQELTKNIRFVLKDNNEGEIKLILKPEALGKVRINLNLSENNIVGKIIVENSSVRQAFLNNLPELTRTLEESGFGSASLDVSLGGGQSGEGRQNRQETASYFTGSAVEEIEGQIPVIYEDGVNLSQINLVV